MLQSDGLSVEALCTFISGRPLIWPSESVRGSKSCFSLSGFSTRTLGSISPSQRNPSMAPSKSKFSAETIVVLQNNLEDFRGSKSSRRKEIIQDVSEQTLPQGSNAQGHKKVKHFPPSPFIIDLNNVAGCEAVVLQLWQEEGSEGKVSIP